MASCTTVEIDTEKERYKAMCFILRAGENRYVYLLEELRKGVYRGRDEYPNTVSNAYELLLRTSQQIGYSQRRMGQPSHRSRTSRKVKVSFLHNKADAADAEDAVDVEQNAETKIIKRKWRDVTKFCTEESDAIPTKNLDITQTNV